MRRELAAAAGHLKEMGDECGLTISVVVPSFNRANYLRETIESILSQEYRQIECIIVDGGSTDGSLGILEGYGDRITWLSEPDRGAFDAINRGWKLSHGEILAWLNADDLWEPGAAGAVAAYFASHPEADVVYGDCGGISPAGRLVDVYPARPWDYLGAVRVCDHIINQAASFVRRAAVERVGGLYPAWCHDHDLWLRLAAAGCEFRALPVHLANARLQDANLGNDPTVVIPAKLGLTRRFFELPGLSAEVRALERRAISNAYVRGLDYVRPSRREHWSWGLFCLRGAIAADPLNTPRVAAAVIRRLGYSVSSSRVTTTASMFARLVLVLALVGTWWELRQARHRRGRG